MPAAIIHLHKVILIEYIVAGRHRHLLFEVSLAHLPVQLFGPDNFLFEVALYCRYYVGVYYRQGEGMVRGAGGHRQLARVRDEYDAGAVK
jgi:hypothetical protein